MACMIDCDMDRAPPGRRYGGHHLEAISCSDEDSIDTSCWLRNGFNASIQDVRAFRRSIAPVAGSGYLS